MDSLPSAPIAPSETPDETIKRLTAELREAHEHQTATTELLQIINSSTSALAPVFDAILEKAHALCGAAHGVLLLGDEEEFRLAAVRGEPCFVEAWRQLGPVRQTDESTAAQLMRGEVIHVADALCDDRYRYRNDPPRRRMVEVGGVRTLLVVPLRKDEALVGIITAFRQEVRPFSERQITLLQNFAAQAVIAMENARLLSETREALEQQTATADVLQVINSSPGELAPVFEAILEKAHSLCGIAFGGLELYDGGKFRSVTQRGHSDQLAELLRKPFEPAPGSPHSR